MCTFDGAKYLPQQLESILEQTRHPDEVVVCDDGSSDTTVSILEAFAHDAPFDVVVRRNHERLGPSANFDQGIALARHDLIALSDQDDMWRPNRLERQHGALVSLPTAGLCFSDAEIVDQASQPIGQRIWSRVGFRPPTTRLSADQLLNILARRTVVTGATLMFRSGVARVAGTTPPGWLHDEWLALVGSAAGFDSIAIDEPLISYRLHGDQHTGLRVATVDLQAMRSGRRPISNEVARSTALLGRLDELSSIEPQRQHVIRDRHRHLQSRELASGSRLGPRTVAVLRQLVRLRYHRYSNGWTSALADLAGRTSGGIPTAK